VLAVSDKEDKQIYYAECKNRNTIFNDYKQIVGLLTNEVKDE